MKVAIIGCGPAGLAATHAAIGLDAHVTLIAPICEGPTPQRGPLLLQQPIPGVSTSQPDGYIRQIVIGGSIMDYRYRLYGDINVNINGDILQHGYNAWDHNSTYRKLWAMYIQYGTDLIEYEERYIPGHELRQLHNQFDLVVSTAPANRMCMRPHQCKFVSADVHITEEASYPGQPEDTIIFNAGEQFPWVRSSRIFGNEVTEWVPGTVPQGMTSRRIRKPISTTCTCFPHVLRTGRFGAWRNETWVHTAYNDTRTAIISMSRKAEWDAVK